MAYKFQLGTARLSGSLVQEGQIKAHESKLSGSTIGLGDASGLAEAGGGIANSDGKLELSMDSMAGVAFSMNQDKIFFSAVGNAGGNIRSGSLADLADGFAGSALSATNGVIAVALNTSGGIEVGGTDQLNIKLDSNPGLQLGAGGLKMNLDGNSLQLGSSGVKVNVQQIVGNGVENNSGLIQVKTHSSGGIDTNGPNASLQIKLVDTQALSLSATGLDLNDTIGGNRTFSNDVTITGNLTVNGTTTSISTTNLEVEDANIVIASGSAAADNNGITFGTPAHGTTHELKITDSVTRLSSSLALAAPTFYGDGSNLTGLSADAATKIRRTVSSTSAGDMDISDDGGVNYFAITASATAVIDPGFSAGHELNIKAGPLVSESVVLTVSGAGGANYTFDGFDTIQLESPNASIKLILRNATDWMIF